MPGSAVISTAAKDNSLLLRRDGPGDAAAPCSDLNHGVPSAVRSAATRDALVAAARPLFAAHRSAEVSIDSIAAAAGVTRGALYHQFPDKTTLFEASVRPYRRAVRPGLDALAGVCYLHVLALVRVLLAQGIELGRIRPQPVMPLAHVLMGAGDEAALNVAEAADRTQARAEMIGILDQLIQGLTA
jgi:AcrR family transcriptional regulator